MNRGIYLNIFTLESNEKNMIENAYEISKIFSKYFKMMRNMKIY